VRYFEHLKANNFNPRTLYSAKLSFKTEGRIKTFHEKQKLKQYMITKPAFQRTLKVMLYTEDDNKHSHKRMGIIKP
jgi:hypothetical protein